jgi:hypothetical protein
MYVTITLSACNGVVQNGYKSLHPVSADSWGGQTVLCDYERYLQCKADLHNPHFSQLLQQNKHFALQLHCLSEDGVKNISHTSACFIRKI